MHVMASGEFKLEVLLERAAYTQDASSFFLLCQDVRRGEEGLRGATQLTVIPTPILVFRSLRQG